MLQRFLPRVNFRLCLVYMTKPFKAKGNAHEFLGLGKVVCEHLDLLIGQKDVKIEISI